MSVSRLAFVSHARIHPARSAEGSRVVPESKEGLKNQKDDGGDQLD